jgi:hypothetical protein
MLIGVPIRPPAAALAACAALAGCSLGGDEEPKPISGAPKEIARVVDELERATRTGDWAVICQDLFSAAAFARAGGRDCERLLEETAGDVHGADIRLMSIELEGKRARAAVRTRAEGQAPVEDTVVLVRERGEWRIEALAAG